MADMNRRGLLAGLFALAVAAPAALIEDSEAATGPFDFLRLRRKAKVRKALRQQATSRIARRKPAKRIAAAKKPKRRSRVAYAGRRIVDFASGEKRGTIIIRTSERALYQVLGGGKAMRYLVAVGKEGFSWAGTARVGRKAVDPSWTPPPEMIERSPKFAIWADGMPGGIPENPLGVRALYLYRGKGDTGFRIHGTNAPGSIGTAASSGCIRMLNNEVIELYNSTPRGTKVIVI
jgi:lipoprotein-anchoring transpeptidase ErfK/SrfK